VVAHLDNPELPIAATDNINPYIWQKAIVNVVFNSICPLLGVDNGIFIREPTAVVLAETLIAECTQVARTEGVHLDLSDLRQQILDISADYGIPGASCAIERDVDLITEGLIAKGWIAKGLITGTIPRNVGQNYCVSQLVGG